MKKEYLAPEFEYIKLLDTAIMAAEDFTISGIGETDEKEDPFDD